MKDDALQTKNEYDSAHQQGLSNNSEHKQEPLKQKHDDEDEFEKERSSDILKKYLECLKSPSGKRRRRCISQELG